MGLCGAVAMNLKYEYALHINVECIAGKGYADLMFISRHVKKKSNQKMGCTSDYCRIKKKKSKETAKDEISQIENRGCTKNLPSMRTNAKGRVEVGLNFGFDPSQNGLSVMKSNVIIKPERFTELIETAPLSQDEIKASTSHFYYLIVDSLEQKH